MTSKVIYTGGLHTQATHLKSGTVIETDAPTDNNGKGESFSPTDLVATALSCCMMTIMGIASRTHDINIEGTTCDIEKIMASNPRRIDTVRVNMTVKGSNNYTDKQKKILEHAALTCPVYLSLHPDVKRDVHFVWPN